VRARSGSELRHALPDCPAEVRGLIGELVDGVTEALEESVVGIYLHGSLVFGDFRPETSDLDLIVVLRSEPRRSRASASARALSWSSAPASPCTARGRAPAG
jgi:hypothetical protein